MTINGGDGFDTLLFDAKGKPINAFDASGQLIASAQPMLPDGGIQVHQNNNATVHYQRISRIPGYEGALVSAGGPYTITAGQGLTLHGAATPATNSTIESEGWQFNGDGDFADAIGLSPVLTWSDLISLGLNGPGTYPIALRVYSNSNTVNAYTTVTISPAAPVVTVAGAANATLSEPYTITFSAPEVPDVNYGVTGWFVDWGDGTTSTLPSLSTTASHVYDTTGGRLITATATDPYGTYSASLSTSVTEAPIVFSASVEGPYTISAGQDLTLSASATGAPTSFNWDITGSGQFTDATISTSGGASNGQVTLSWAQLQALGIDEGTYSGVRVEAIYSDGSTVISTPTTLLIQPTPPTATTFTSSGAVLGGAGSVSFANPFDPSAAQTQAGFTYSYDFTNNGHFDIAGSTNPSADIPSDLLAQPGSFVAHGRITASDGTYSDYYTSITVADVAPTVEVGPDQTISEGSLFTLSGVTFSDLGYATPNAGWSFTATIDWGDGKNSAGLLTVNQGSTGLPTTGVVSGSHRYRPGQYTVTVTVRDAHGVQGDGSFLATVQAAITTSTMTVVPGPSEAVGEGTLFIPSQAGFINAAAPDTATATIDWGDGSPVQDILASELNQPPSPADLGTINTGHIYGKPGQYTVEFSVTNSRGVTDSGSFLVNVVDVAPSVAPVPNLNQSPGVPVELNAKFSDPGFPVGGVAESFTASIDWGDGTTSDGVVTMVPGGAGVSTKGTVTGSHTYSAHGNYPVTVTVMDSLGQQGQAMLTALDVPPSVTAGTSQTVDQGSLVIVSATFSDPGFETGATSAGYTATIDWGDGTTSEGTLVVAPGGPGAPTTGTIDGSHVYSDQGRYTVTVSIIDGGGGVGQDVFTATVVDVGPTLMPLPTDPLFFLAQPTILHANFTEPGIDLKDVVTVDWGDGTIQTIDGGSTYLDAEGVEVPVLVEPTATSPGSIALGHVYHDTDPHMLTVTVTDKDGKSSTVSELIQPWIATTTTVTVAPNPVYFGQPITFTAKVDPVAPGVGSPIGTVTFVDSTTGATLAMVDVSDGIAAWTTSVLPPGTQTIVASYSGGGVYYPSASGAGEGGSVTIDVVGAVFVLNPTAKGALSLTGSSSLDIPGKVWVDSQSSSAIVVSGGAEVTAGMIEVVGGYDVSGNGSINSTLETGAAGRARSPGPTAGAAGRRRAGLCEVERQFIPDHRPRLL